MANTVAVVINGNLIMEYDRNKRLPGHQRQYLDKMEADMEAGITLAEERIVQPDFNQKMQFVTVNLINALLHENEAVASATCTYLANRLPDLKQVHAKEQNGEISAELVFDREYAANEQKIEFSRPRPRTDS